MAETTSNNKNKFMTYDAAAYLVKKVQEYVSTYDVTNGIDLTEYAKKEDLLDLRGEKGETGNGISRVFLDNDYNLMIITTDGDISNLGCIKGADGSVSFEDLTDEQKASLKGDKGDKMTFDDLTEDEKLALKGERGEKGETGAKGADGTMTFADLTEAQRDMLKGDKGEQGEKGETGSSGVYYGKTAPRDKQQIWIRPNDTSENLDDYATKNYVDNVLVELGSMNPDSYALKSHTHDYNELNGLPTLGKAASRNVATSVKQGSSDLVSSAVLYDALQDYVPNIDGGSLNVSAPTIELSKTNGTTTIKVTNSDGTNQSINVYDGVSGAKGDKGDKGEKGDNGAPFTYDMFTAEQLEALKGADGTMVFEDLTADQKASLKGDKGEKGKDGEDGFSPVVSANINNTTAVYKLDITTATGVYTTDNLKGSKGDALRFEDLTSEQKAELKGEKGQDGTVSFESLTDAQLNMLRGQDGRAFTYDDFTEEQLAALKGEKGDDGTVSFDSLTSAQKASLKGEKGDKGDKGDVGEKGDKGDAFTYDDFTTEQLNSLKGENGTNGVSPTITTSTLSDGSGSKITITGADGTKYVTVKNGKDGKDGEKGENGKDGKDGADGMTPDTSMYVRYQIVTDVPTAQDEGVLYLVI